MLKDIWIIMLISGFSMLFVSVLLFFVWRVPDILDELSGRKARRSIELLRNNSNIEFNEFSQFKNGDIYISTQSSSLLQKELGNIQSGLHNSEKENYLESEELPTSDMEDSINTDSMSDNEVQTSYFEIEEVEIVVLEEQSSL